MTTIHNGQGIRGYEQYPTGQTEGQIHSDAKAKRYYNPLLPQLGTATVGGTATAGDYTLIFKDPSGNVIDSVTFTRVAEANAAIASGLVDLIAASGALRNVVTAEVDGGTPEQINLAFLAADVTYTIEQVAPAPGTIALVTTQAAGGVSIPVGRFLSQSASNSLAVEELGAADLEGAVMGVSGRDFALLHNLEQPGTGPEVYVKGSAVTMIYKGVVSMRNVGAAVLRGMPVYVVRNTAGGDELGQARGDADGANTVALTLSRAEWIEDVAAGEVGRIRLNLSA